MKTHYLILFCLALTLASVSSAYADCYKDGKAYPTGTIINGFICTPDGRWVRH